jgi:hypothetical protein
MWIDKDHVVTEDVIVIWDGMTKPSTSESNGAIVHNVKVATKEGSVTHQELQKLADDALAASKWKGVKPPKFQDPINAVDLTKIPELPGYVCFSANTQLGAPPVMNANNQEMPPLSYARSFYAGSVIRVLVHAYDYDNKNKGVAFGLDGIQIINDKAPALSIGAGMSKAEVSNAFAGGAAAPAPGIQGGKRSTKPGCPYTYESLMQAGWSEQQMIDAGHLDPLPAAPAAPAPAPAVPSAPAAPAAPAAPVAPRHDMLPAAPAAPVSKQSKMTATAQFSYDQYVASGWTDQNLIDNGFMLP